MLRYLILSILLLSEVVYSQQYDRAPISITLIEKSMNNVEDFRLAMLDNNFQLLSKDKNGESWHVPVEKNDPGYVDVINKDEKVILEMTGKSKLNQLSKISIARYLNHLDDRTIKLIRVQIRKDILPEYKKAFDAKIRAIYNIKKIIPVIISPNTMDEKNNFEIGYFRKGSNIEVHMDDTSDIWYLVDFSTTKFNRNY